MTQDALRSLFRRSLATALAGLAWLLPGVSSAQPATRPAPDAAAVGHAVVNLLANGCSKIGDADVLERFARAHGFAPARSEFRPMFHRFASGSVWILQRPDVNLAMLWTDDALQCRVVAQTADIAATQEYFRAVVEGVSRPGLEVHKEVDGAAEDAGRRFHQIGYRLQNRDNPRAVARAYVLTTFPPPTDAVFAVIALVAATSRR